MGFFDKDELESKNCTLQIVSYRMKDIEEAWAGGKMEFLAKVVDATHCEEHGNW